VFNKKPAYLMVVYKGRTTLLARWLIILNHVKLQGALKISRIDTVLPQVFRH